MDAYLEMDMQGHDLCTFVKYMYTYSYCYIFCWFCAAIIELFHLLPHAASKFLDELVTLTIDLEGAFPPGQVHSEINSPYRLPLTKFLNRYATLAVDYFLARLSDPKYFRR
jgi:hypothetical protein